MGAVEHVTVKPLLQSVPGFDLTLEQWDAWSRLAASARPRRALAKIGFAVAELFGLGKQGPLFEEAMAVHMVRTVRQVVEHHPVIVAAKTRRAPAASHQWRALIQSVPAARSGPVVAGATVAMTVTATNAGSTTWRAHPASGLGQVRLGVQVLDGESRLLARDHHRVALPHDVAPGQEVTLTFHCPVPETPGRYRLKRDFVAEGITWFEAVGSPADVAEIDVIAATAGNPD